MKGRLTSVLLACVWFVLQANAQQSSIEIRGYAKNLAVRLSIPPSEKPYFLNVSRFRARTSVSVTAGLRAEVWLDTELQTGNFVSAENELVISQEPEIPRPIRVDWTIAISQTPPTIEP